MIDNVSFIVLKIIFHGCSNTAPKSKIEIDTVVQQLPPDSQMSTLRIQRTAIAVQQCQNLDEPLAIGIQRQFLTGFSLLHGFT